uniref:Uncharacterized protein n=1 Tax=Oncorhynchus tshawytscha TaxID=74940 RepID=A0A8C8GXB3_ONCTS
MGVEKTELDEGDSTLMSGTKSPKPCLSEVVGTMFFVFIVFVPVIENVESGGMVQPALVHGLAVAVMVFNIFMQLNGQLIGGVLGAAMSKMISKENYTNRTSWRGQIFGEIAIMCLVSMVVLLVAVNSKSKSPMVPFLVGRTVIINILAGDVSGTCLKPAGALAPAVMANYWTYHWVYWAGPIAGGLLAFLGQCKVHGE